MFSTILLLLLYCWSAGNRNCVAYFPFNDAKELDSGGRAYTQPFARLRFNPARALRAVSVVDGFFVRFGTGLV